MLLITLKNKKGDLFFVKVVKKQFQTVEEMLMRSILAIETKMSNKLILILSNFIFLKKSARL